MKKIVLLLVLLYSMSYAGLLDAISYGAKTIGAPSVREKELMQKEFDKADKEAMELADKRMQLCVQIFNIHLRHSESEAERIINENKELREYIEYSKVNEAEKKRCFNRVEREVLIMEQEQQAYNQEINDTSSLYHLLELYNG